MRETRRTFYGSYVPDDQLASQMDRENNTAGALYALRKGNPVDVLKKAEFTWIENGVLVRGLNPFATDPRLENLRIEVPIEARGAPGEPDNEEH